MYSDCVYSLAESIPESILSFLFSGGGRGNQLKEVVVIKARLYVHVAICS